MKSANIEWNDKTLDEWIADPQHVVAGNQMTFAGIKDPKLDETERPKFGSGKFPCKKNRASKDW